STNHNGTGFGLEHDTRRALIVDDVTGKRVEKKMHAGFVQQIQSNQLEYFGIERDDVASLQRRGNGSVGSDETIQQSGKDACHDRFSRSMVCRQERGFPWFVIARL